MKIRPISSVVQKQGASAVPTIVLENVSPSVVPAVPPPPALSPQSQPLRRPPPLPPLQAPLPVIYSQPLPSLAVDSSDSDTSEHSGSQAKRRRASGGHGEVSDQQQGGTRAATTTITTTSPEEVGSGISRSASIIAEALQASEEREEKRDKDLLNLHERRLKIEESKEETNRHGLVEAINNLANSILTLASHSNPPSDPSN
ncbi:hypothetical protein Ancab_019106 [Ancistrocladus abbreviatus]